MTLYVRSQIETRPPVPERPLGPLAAQAPQDVDTTEALRQELGCPDLVGRSDAMRSLLQQVAACADLPVRVLLTGPSGSGKSALAEVLHENSRQRGAFVTVNCSHLCAERALVDLFGARAGAYTGLTRDRAGLVEEARGGTLFLDEVDTLPCSVQAQLLTWLQDGRYRRVGETRLRQATEVRVVAASNADLEEAVANGRLRADLRYRLAQFEIAVPGLEERPSDLPLLAHALVDRAAGALGVPVLPLSVPALAWIETRPWPGHVRELENCLRAGLIRARADAAVALQLAHLDPEGGPSHPTRRPTLHDAGRRFKIRYASAVLRECGGNRSEAARRLGIHRSSLYELLAAESPS